MKLLGAVAVGGGLAYSMAATLSCTSIETLIVAYLLGLIIPQPSKIMGGGSDGGDGE